MAVSGAAAGAAAAAAAARAAAEARRRAEEARRRAEEARRAAEAAKKAAEAAKQRAAQQQNKVAEHAKQLQAAVKKAAEKAARPTAKNEAATAEKTLKTHEAQQKKEVADAQKLEQHAKQLADAAKKATEDASSAQQAAEAAQKTQKLTEHARDLGEDFAQKAISGATKSLGKSLKDATTEEATGALTDAIRQHGAGISGDGSKIDDAAKKLGEAFHDEAHANLRDALGKGADQVLKSPELVKHLQDAASRISGSLGSEKLNALESKGGASTLDAKLKASLVKPTASTADARVDSLKPSNAKEAKAQANDKTDAAKKAQEDARTKEEKAQRLSNDATEARSAQKKLEERKNKVEGKLRTQENAVANRERETPKQQKEIARLRAQANKLDKKNEQADARASKLEADAKTAKTEAATAHQKAIDSANEALKAQKDANAAAKAEGKDEPFKAANKVKDALDAGSLDAKQQKEIFGTKLAVTPTEAAKADAKSVQEAAKKGPGAGARELRRQIEQSNDPAYRDALFKEADKNGTIQTIRDGLTDQNVPQSEVNHALKDLGTVGDAVGPDATRTLSQYISGGISTPVNGAPVPTGDGGEKILKGLKANEKDPATARLAIGASNDLRTRGDFLAAQRVTDLSPHLAQVAKEPTRVTKAREALEVKTAADQRHEVEDAQKQQRADTKQESDKIFAMAGKDKKDLPKGVTVKQDPNNPNKVELVRKNDDGKVVERTVATRGANGAAGLDSTTYDKKGNARRDVVQTKPDGSTSSSTAEWKPHKGADRTNPPSIEELKKSRTANATITETSTQKTPDGKGLININYKQDPKTGIQRSQSTFTQQKGGSGIDDKLEDHFDFDKPVDKVETRTYSVPPPGTKGPDGKPAEATYTRTQQYSQLGVSATAQTSHPLDTSKLKLHGPLNSEDFSRVHLSNIEHEEFDGSDSHPKQWTLETGSTRISDGNTYARQTFVEGHPDATVVTYRHVEGGKVIEDSEGKAFSTDPSHEGKLVDVKRRTVTQYNDDGLVSRQTASGNSPDGSTFHNEYQRHEYRNDDGKLEVKETNSSTVTDKDGVTHKSNSEQVSRESKDGLQLIHAKETVSGPEGYSTATISPHGTTLELNGQKINSTAELKQFGPEQQFLAASAHDGLQAQINNFGQASGADPDEFGGSPGPGEKKGPDLSNEKQGVNTAKGGLKILSNVLEKPLTDGIQIGYGRTQSLTATEFSASKLGIASGALGVVQNGLGFATALQNGNYVEAAKAAAGLTGAAADTVVGGVSAVNAVKNGGLAELNGFGELGTAAKIAGKVSVVAGVVTGGIDLVSGVINGDEIQQVKGAIGVATAVGGYLAAGAAAGAWGGPAGAAVGLAVGLVGFGATKLVDAAADEKHQIADVEI